MYEDDTGNSMKVGKNVGDNREKRIEEVNLIKE
jgi:hypothetical protein